MLRTYYVQTVRIKNNILIVNLKKSVTSQVESEGEFKGKWKWVMLLQIDKTDLKDNMKIVVKK